MPDLARYRRAALFWVCASALFACQENAALLRLTTYPPDFRYITDEELESVMWRLASRVHEFEHVAKADAPQVDTMLAILEGIEFEARSLESTGGGSNHPYLQSKLPAFLSIIERSKMGLRSDPPRITTVDEVWQACSGCHERS